MKIDLVAPPYAGHLFPLLDLAGRLKAEGFEHLRVLSTADAARAVQLCNLRHVTLLDGYEGKIKAIANTGAPVGFNPFRLYRQFQINMSLMADLHDQLRREWTEHRPDVVIADFTVPVAGLVATQLGIRWWTTTPSPCALESRTGTPYLGGWMPATGFVGRMRDASARRLIRLFKLGVAAVFKRPLRKLGFPGVYRADGYEAMYSPERIFGLGIREFEFDHDWPAAFEFIGPLTGCPPFPYPAPEFPSGKPAILITLGTHLPWARQRAAELMERVATLVPDCVFHFAQGSPGSIASSRRANFHSYGFIPYQEYLSRYAAAVIHGGTGIIYQCIHAGVPMLVWPHDFDQYDHAARLVHNGIGMRLRPTAGAVCNDLRTLLSAGTVRSRLRDFQGHLSRYDPGRSVIAALNGISRVGVPPSGGIQG